MANGHPELLKGLAPEDALRIVKLGTAVPVPAGSELFGLGDEADSLYLVTRGRIRLTLPSATFSKRIGSGIANPQPG